MTSLAKRRATSRRSLLDVLFPPRRFDARRRKGRSIKRPEGYRRPHRLTPSDRTWIKQKHALGLSTRLLSLYLRCCQSTVRSALKRDRRS